MSDKEQDSFGPIDARFVRPEDPPAPSEIQVVVAASLWESQGLIVVDIVRKSTNEGWGIILSRDSAIALAHQLLTAAKA